MPNQVQLQRAYYAQTAADYDAMHLGDPEHEFALSLMMAAIEFFDIRSVLDIGSGTGRALLGLKKTQPKLRLTGIEPSPELRQIGHAKGLLAEELVNGDALSLAFPDNSFDLVCEFGALHHIPNPARAIQEMMRVAKVAVFISDNNDYGRGTALTKAIKQTSRALGLWPLLEHIWTKGKGYRITPDDGLWYSFSIFDHYDAISAQCDRVHLTNARGSGADLYRSATHIALLGILKGSGAP